jgi:aspartate aminotransferase-like enzyme
MMTDWTALLDPPPFPDEAYGRLADRLAVLMRTRSDMLLVQSEAIVALEAVATSLARPGLRALNIVTSPYGALFGAWLRRGGATVVDLTAEAGRPIAIEAVADALGAEAFDVLALVHAESASGILNPLPEIAALAREQGTLVVVDAVASVGGHALAVDDLGIGIAVIGPQKALAGPAGLSAISVSPAAWALVGAPPAASSVLSLADIRRDWLDRGRGALPGTPVPLELWALQAALDRVEAEGIDAIVARHGRAAAATRAGLRAMRLEPWIADDASASALVTAAPVPPGIDASLLVRDAIASGGGVSAGIGPAGFVRLNHTGRAAALASVQATVGAYGEALGRQGFEVDPAAGVAAAAAAFG